MNKSEAIEKIIYSLSTEEAQVITPKGEVYEEHVSKLTSILLDCVIEPIEVKVTSSCAEGGSLDKFKTAKVWAIARNKDSWLLTIEGEYEYALGFGENPLDIMLHGFSSSDVLGEWCA